MAMKFAAELPKAYTREKKISRVLYKMMKHWELCSADMKTAIMTAQVLAGDFGLRLWQNRI